MVQKLSLSICTYTALMQMKLFCLSVIIYLWFDIQLYLISFLPSYVTEVRLIVHFLALTLVTKYCFTLEINSNPFTPFLEIMDKIPGNKKIIYFPGKFSVLGIERNVLKAFRKRSTPINSPQESNKLTQ